MLRSGIRSRKGRKDTSPQVVAVAVNSKKNSQNALKWAADNAISKSQVFFLIHVRKKIITIPTPTGEELPISEVSEEAASAFLQQIDLQTKELLLPFQCFCSRRLLQCEEIILDDLDISKAIIDYVVLHSIDKLILGSSSRNTFTRAFRSTDIPTSVMKLAPNFCSVYIISKGKVSSLRLATQPNERPQKLASNLEAAGNSFKSAKSWPSGPVEEFSSEQAGQSGPNSSSGSESGFSGHGYSQMRSPEAPRTSWPSKSQAYNINTLNSHGERTMESTRFSREAATGIKVQKHDGRFLLEAERVLDSLSADVPFRRYSIQDIEKATDNFSEKLKIGEGGYGPVFKANVDNTSVAIKILHGNGSQGVKQFQQEVELLSRIEHPNMVLLLGACPDRGCLVYEYMANGSLEDRLFCYNDTPPLSWKLRFKIAAEIASGLLFLHEMKPEALVHRDLKPANILLDDNFVSKIADIGLARLVPPSVANAVTQYQQTAAAGTFCYIDPEYQQTGLLGIKSDVYALGIILLQLLTAQAPMGLAHNAESAIHAGMFVQILDPSVPDWPVEEALKLAEVALKCSELRRKDRPDLRKGVLPVLTWLVEFANQK